MSIPLSLRRIMSVLGLVLFVASAADAQTYQPTTYNVREHQPEDGPFLPKYPNTPPATGQYQEPEFVPYVNDLQMFDQPDLSPYGRGPRPTEGWFGSAEYLHWAIQQPARTPIGDPTPRTVFASGSRPVNTGNTTITTINVLTTPNVGVTITNLTVTINGAPISVTLNNVAAPVGLVFTTPVAAVISSTLTQDGAIGNPNALVGRGGVTQISTLDTGWMNSDFTSGGRFEFGRINDGRGWLISSFNLSSQVQDLTDTNVSVNFANGPVGFVDIESGNPVAATPGPQNNVQFLGDGYDDDLDGDGVYGRFGRDRGTRAGTVFNPPLDGIPDPENPSNPPVAVDWDDAVQLPTVFQNITVQNRTSMYGVEAMRLWRLALGPRGGIWEFFLGPRYLDFKDFQSVATEGPNTNPRYYLNPIADADWFTETQNQAVLAQIGGRWAIQRDRVQLSIETRLFAGANFQSFRQQGQFGSRYYFPVPEVTANTVPLRDDVVNGQLPHTFQHAGHSTQFMPGGELRLNLKYQVFRSVYLQLGYTAMYATNIARAAPMVRYSFPDMGLREDNNHQNLFVNGVDFGVVVNR